METRLIQGSESEMNKSVLVKTLLKSVAFKFIIKHCYI